MNSKEQAHETSRKVLGPWIMYESDLLMIVQEKSLSYIHFKNSAHGCIATNYHGIQLIRELLSILLKEGFDAAEMEAYHLDLQKFVTPYLRTQDKLEELAKRIEEYSYEYLERDYPEDEKASS